MLEAVARRPPNSFSTENDTLMKWSSGIWREVDETK
jgi:hypothetical protein